MLPNGAAAGRDHEIANASQSVKVLGHCAAGGLITIKRVSLVRPGLFPAFAADGEPGLGPQ